MSKTRFLADTHILLWALGDDARLPERHRGLLLSDAEIFVSAATIWEIAIKKSLGKLKAPDDLTRSLQPAGFSALDITAAHAEAVTHLPFHHSDPFDRLLIVQGRVEGLTIMTVDEKFALYDVETV